MPSRVYRHPGGLREERAHLLSESENTAGGSSSAAPVQAAAVRLVAEMDPKSPRKVADDEDDDGNNFTDLTEDAALCSKDPV